MRDIPRVTLAGPASEWTHPVGESVRTSFASRIWSSSSRVVHPSILRRYFSSRALPIPVFSRPAFLIRKKLGGSVGVSARILAT
jgi:hypothetical protein